MAIDPIIFARVSIGFNIVVIIFIALYHMTVPLQFIPTSKYLPAANITCYATHLPLNMDSPATTDVGGWEWTLLLLDELRWLYPGFLFMSLVLAFVIKGVGFAFVTLVVYLVLLIIDGIKLFFRIDEYWFCSNWQICPRCNGPDDMRCPPEDTSCPHSYLIKWIFWTNVGFIFLGILYIILGYVVTRVNKSHFESMERKKTAFLEKYKNQHYQSLLTMLNNQMDKIL